MTQLIDAATPTDLSTSAMSVSAVGFCITSADTTIASVNQTAAVLLGRPMDELPGRSLYAMVLEEDLPEVRKLVRRVQLGKPAGLLDARITQVDGGVLWVTLTAAQIAATSETPAKLVINIIDGAAKKRSEADLHSSNQILFHAKGVLEEQKAELDAKAQELEIARAQAERSARSKGEFLANMSHEIRTPMTAILGYAEMLNDANLPTEQRQECVATIRRNGEHLLGIINDILDMAKIDAGKMTVESIETSVSEVVSQVVSLMKLRATEKKIDFKLEFAGRIPRMIKTDPLRLRQVLLNLLGNAIKFTDAGSVTLQVDMSRPGERDGLRMLRFVVHDTGVGMNAEQQRRLFEPFHQLDPSHSRKFGGTGLGLAITRRLVAMLGGTIEVSSMVGMGSTFVLSLDVGASEQELIDPLQEISQPRRQEGFSMPALRGRVLVAEDGEDNRRLVGYLLRKCELEPVIVPNGRMAVEAATSAIAGGTPFDLILMDMQMPEVDGYEATAILRSSGVKTPIVAMTAHAMTQDREKCLQAGCTEFLAKPMDRAAFVRLLSRFLAPADVPGDPNAARLQSAYCEQAEMKKIIQQYVAEMPEMVSKLTHLLAEHQLQELRKLTHEIKGAGGGYGFEKVSTLAAEAEAAIRLGADMAVIRRSIDSLVAMIRSIEGYPTKMEGL